MNGLLDEEDSDGDSDDGFDEKEEQAHGEYLNFAFDFVSRSRKI